MKTSVRVYVKCMRHAKIPNAAPMLRHHLYLRLRGVSYCFLYFCLLCSLARSLVSFAFHIPSKQNASLIPPMAKAPRHGRKKRSRNQKVQSGRKAGSQAGRQAGRQAGSAKLPLRWTRLCGVVAARAERCCWSHLILVDDEPEVEVEGKRRDNVEEAGSRRQDRQCEVPPRDGRDFIVPSVEGHFSSDAPHLPLLPRR